jgi:hypothetical protein
MKKWIIFFIILTSIFIFLFYSCNTIIFYEKINNKDEWYIKYEMPDNENDIQLELEYLNQENLLMFSNFRTHMFFRTNGKEVRDQIIVEECSLNVYKLNGEIIEPIEQNYRNDGSITKIYKYSIFFPNEIIIEAKMKFTYKNVFYEYNRKAKIIKKRNRFYWDIAMGI